MITRTRDVGRRHLPFISSTSFEPVTTHIMILALGIIYEYFNMGGVCERTKLYRSETVYECCNAQVQRLPTLPPSPRVPIFRRCDASVTNFTAAEFHALY
ncbi:hypothetical protein EVAR_15913_1 [Eumeta japonica]|uniref:Uncharacterized protein n=1 Tax=Eumeta variegata TaxID=151549 RepID=A0A4C1ULU3_EUMVA|nr:hypothetical protein EVAR_15913_1 [Eumeta japonica]